MEFIGIEIRENDGPVERRILEVLEGGFGGLHHQIKEMEKKFMAAIDDLKAADVLEASTLATLGQAVADVATRVGEIGAGLPTDDPAVVQAAADLNAHVATMQQLAAALAAIAPAATVTNPPANPVT